MNRFKVVVFSEEKVIASASFYSQEAAIQAMQEALSKGLRADMVDLSKIDTETAVKIAPFIGP